MDWIQLQQMVSPYQIPGPVSPNPVLEPVLPNQTLYISFTDIEPAVLESIVPCSPTQIVELGNAASVYFYVYYLIF